MLTRISLIVAIVAGLAVSGLNFIKVKEKITTIQKEREDEKSAKVQAQTELASTKKDLDKTSADLKTTKATLETTSAELAKATSDLANQTKLTARLTEERDKVVKERNDAQADLAAYVGTGLKPEQILSMNKNYKSLQAALDASQDEKKLLGQKITRLQTELDQSHRARRWDHHKPPHRPPRRMAYGQRLETSPSGCASGVYLRSY